MEKHSVLRAVAELAQREKELRDAYSRGYAEGLEAAANLANEYQHHVLIASVLKQEARRVREMGVSNVS